MEIIYIKSENNKNIVRYLCDSVDKSNPASDILLLSDQIKKHAKLIENMERCLYAGDRHVVVYGREIEDNKGLIKTAQKVLPKHTLSDTVSVNCVLIKRSLINLLGFLDPSYSSLQYALMDYYCRYNKYGFSSVISNHALYSPVASDKATQDNENNKDKELFLLRYPDWEKTAKKHGFERQDPRIDFLKLLDKDYYPKKRILFDYLSMPPMHGGTSEYQLFMFEAFSKLFKDKYDIYLLTTYLADEYHKLSKKYDNILFPDTINGVFHLGFSANQLMFHDQLVSINKYCLKIVQIMHDIMMLRVDNHFPFDVVNTTELGAAVSDGIIFVSNYSKDDFLTYINDNKNVKDIELDVIYVATRNKEPIRNDYELPFDDYFLIAGSEFKHKAVKEAIDVFQKSDKNFIVIGYKDNEYVSDNIYTYKSGHLDEDFLCFVYKNCKAVILPSLYEGFGSPIAIGLRYNKHVIVFNNALNVELKKHFNQYKKHILFFERFEQIAEIVDKFDSLPALEQIEYTDSWDRMATEHEVVFAKVLQKEVSIDKLIKRNNIIKNIEDKRLDVLERKTNEIDDINEANTKEMGRVLHEMGLIDARRHKAESELNTMYEQFNDYKLFSMLKFSIKENIKHRHPGLSKKLRGKKDEQ